MQNIAIGDDVYSHTQGLFARVYEVFPAAVCVRIGKLTRYQYGLELVTAPQLWRADEIENLSVCQHCGSREELHTEHDTGIPFRLCSDCAAHIGDELSHGSNSQHSASAGS